MSTLSRRGNSMAAGDPASRASAFLRSHTAPRWATGSSCDFPRLVEAAERLERLRAHLSVGAAVALDDREARPAGLLVLDLP